MRRSYVVPMRWMVIYEYEVPGGALNLSYTELPRPWSPWETCPSRKNSHGRTKNRTRDLTISNHKLWPLDHEASPVFWMLCLVVHIFTTILQSYRALDTYSIVKYAIETPLVSPIKLIKTKSFKTVIISLRWMTSYPVMCRNFEHVLPCNEIGTAQ
jgi:hypothetical protein